MSGLGRSPWWITVAAIVVCFASASFGQSAKSSSASWASVASVAAAIPANFAVQPATAVFSEPLKYGGDDHKKRKHDGGGGVTVPEGGSPVVYLGLAGFACLAAIYFSRRRSKLAQPPTA
jgi:hypothetical protein